MIPTPWRHAALASLVLAVSLPVAAHAQTAGGFSGFGGSDGGPIQIEARELEVRDKEGVAIFTGDVVVKQGETTLETAKLVVHYVGGGQGAGDGGGEGGKKKAAAAAGTAAPAAPATPAAAEGGAAPVAGSQEIDRLEASGKVLVTSKDQTASGDSATYDGKTEVLELRGDVVLTQGKNVVRGDRLVVEMQTGRARVLSTKSRVQMLLTPGSQTTPAGN
ncbi:LptA/OstA family protein [Pseudoxanthobacter sp. M-2]|uniref:LptA/OstA family protein n=1 Tax=Pseudoxanthobacter sp. M-2 TaxID=3078754 RepID=UPI0038FC7A65